MADQGTIFISYSREDEAWLKKLRTHLSVAVAQGMSLNLFSDTDIQPGQEWRKRLDEELLHADIVVMLITPDFVSSKFIQEEEIPVIKARWEAGKVKIFPILVRSSAVKWDPFLSKLQWLPAGGRAIAEYPVEHQDRLLTEITDKIFTTHLEARQENDTPDMGATEPEATGEDTAQEERFRKNLLKHMRAHLKSFISLSLQFQLRIKKKLKKRN